MVAGVMVASHSTPVLGEGICDVIGGDLPGFCTCQDTSSIGATVACQVNMLGIDTIGLKAEFAPCAMPAHVNLDITEKDLGIDYQIAGLTFGKDADIPVPGLSIDIPDVGEAGVNAAVQLVGNVDAFDAQLGLDACISVGGDKECGSSLVPELPIWVIKGNFTFGSICRAAAVDPVLRLVDSTTPETIPSALRGFAPVADAAPPV